MGGCAVVVCGCECVWASTCGRCSLCMCGVVMVCMCVCVLLLLCCNRECNAMSRVVTTKRDGVSECA